MGSLPITCIWVILATISHFVQIYIQLEGMNYEKYQSWRHNIPFGSLSEKVLKHDFMVVSWSLRFWDLWEGGFKEVSRSICVHLESHAVKTGLNLN